MLAVGDIVGELRYLLRVRVGQLIDQHREVLDGVQAVENSVVGVTPLDLLILRMAVHAERVQRRGSLTCTCPTDQANRDAVDGAGEFHQGCGEAHQEREGVWLKTFLTVDAGGTNPLVHVAHLVKILCVGSQLGRDARFDNTFAGDQSVAQNEAVDALFTTFRIILGRPTHRAVQRDCFLIFG